VLSGEVIDSSVYNQSTFAAVIAPSADARNEELTMKQILLVACLGVGLSVVLLALAIILLALRRRRKQARARQDNLQNENKFLNNHQVYPGDENIQIAFSDKNYMKNTISFGSDQRTDNNCSHYAQVHERQKISPKINARSHKLSQKEVNTVSTNVPLLNECEHSMDSLKHVNETLNIVHSMYRHDRHEDAREKSNHHLESLLNSSTTACNRIGQSTDV